MNPQLPFGFKSVERCSLCGGLNPVAGKPLALVSAPAGLPLGFIPIEFGSSSGDLNPVAGDQSRFIRSSSAYALPPRRALGPAASRGFQRVFPARVRDRES